MSSALEEKQQQLVNNQKDEQEDNKLSSSLDEVIEPEQIKMSQSTEIKNISVTVNSNNKNTINSSRIESLNEVDTNDMNNQQSRGSLIAIKNQRHPRTISNSSSTSSSFNENNYFKQLDTTKNRTVNNSVNLNDGAECLFCQKESKNFKLLSCGSQNCVAVFCPHCITNYLSVQKTQKCPSCRLNFDKNILNMVKDKHSSITPVFNQERLNFNNSNSDTNQFIPRNAVTEAKIYVKILDEPCDGYEKFRTLIVTFEIDDGIQSVIFNFKIS